MTENVKELRDALKEILEILEKLVLLEEKEKAGEDVKKEQEAELGLYMYKMITLNSKLK